MAKLNVKVVDMVNGEITKVTYEGAEYVKFDGKARIGDLALCVNETPFFTVGEFYLSWDLYETGEPRMKDDVDDNYRMHKGCYVLFHKISVDKPTLEQRVGALESDVAALKGEKKDEETIEFEGATYRKVDREALEGDVVIIRNGAGEWFMDGVPYKVLQGILINSVHSSGKMEVYKAAVNRTRETVDVYEPIEQVKYVPQEGDIVVIVKSEHGSRNGVGDIGKVSDVSPINFAVDVPQKPCTSNARGNKHEAYEVRKATSAEVEKYEQAVKDAEIASKWAKIGRKPNEFKKGDVVRVVSHKYGKCEGEIGLVEDAGILGEGGVGVRCGAHYVGICFKGETVELVAPVESLFNA